MQPTNKLLCPAPTYGEVPLCLQITTVNSLGKGSITIAKITHAYKRYFGYNSVLEEPCNININCPIEAAESQYQNLLI